MSSLATRRLIDAAATLDPADRALLNLWVNRGLDDERLTALSGMSVEALGARREKIVSKLAGELGLPEPDVRGALAHLSPEEELATPPHPEPTAQPPGQNGTTAAAKLPRRRRRPWLWLGPAVLAILVAAVIVVNAPAGSSPPRAERPSTPGAASASPLGGTSGPAQRPLAGLPGGLAKASGDVKLTALTLDLTVRELTLPHAGHYEVWLYNSVLDSRPLGALRTDEPRLVVRLPADARHYRWIDVSLQPPGVVNHSGESELRASNPAHTP